MTVARRSSFVVRCLSLFVYCCLPFRCWVFVVCGSFVNERLLESVAACCLWFVVCCGVLCVRCASFVVCCLLLVVRCLVCVVRKVVFVVRCSWFVASRWLLIVCCLLCLVC